MIYITRREHFCAAHKLWNPNWSEAENIEVFGKCANKNWHGHNFNLFVTVKGEINPSTGFVVDLKKLSQLIKTQVIDILDHSNLNLDVPFLVGKMISTEVIAMGIWEQLYAPIKEIGGELHCIKLTETENNYVEYYGGK
jgi:6-pyruvoyltetrahydropterin/6-carboxytetrahydropterin synthase